MCNLKLNRKLVGFDRWPFMNSNSFLLVNFYPYWSHLMLIENMGGTLFYFILENVLCVNKDKGYIFIWSNILIIIGSFYVLSKDKDLNTSLISNIRE